MAASSSGSGSVRNACSVTGSHSQIPPSAMRLRESRPSFRKYPRTYCDCAASVSSRLGGGQKARVIARGPNVKRPLDASVLGSTTHAPFARLQLRRMLTVPSALRRIV